MKIKKLNGFSGIKLKNSQTLEIKKGVNLFVGRNGSGKSNLMKLILKIFNERINIKSPFETEFVRELIIKGINNAKSRIEKSTNFRHRASNVDHIRPEIAPEDVVFCKFEIEGKEGFLSINIDTSINIDISDIENGKIKLEDLHSLWLQDYPVSGGLNFFTKVVQPSIEVKESSIKVNANPGLFNNSNQENPITDNITKNFNSFFYPRLIEFYLNDRELNEKLQEIEKEINRQYTNFLGQTNKRIKLNLNPNRYNGKGMIILTNANNIIDFNQLSDGEKNLFNIIIEFAISKATKPSVISIDEPEIFMHDDMVKTLAKEIICLSEQLNETYILVSTHSSVLIEELAKREDKINLITIDENKEVSNSFEEVAFIKALERNGVSFSTLYVSKRANLFIENEGDEGKKHRDFYMRLFDKASQPNIIPIGASSQVQSKTSYYLDVIYDLLNIQEPKLKNFGIVDGDIWFCKKFKSLLNVVKNDNDKSQYVIDEILKYREEFYISSERNNIYYFNFWEIENLYFVEHFLKYWKKNGEFLRLDILLEIISKNKQKLINSWYKTLKKTNVKQVYYRGDDEEYLSKIKNLELELEAILRNETSTKLLLSNIFEELIKLKYINWFPGKEIYSLITIQGYIFDDNQNMQLDDWLKKAKGLLSN